MHAMTNFWQFFSGKFLSDRMLRAGAVLADNISSRWISVERIFICKFE
jgi:hypothetical protein